jgi:hypothetical protein
LICHLTQRHSEALHCALPDRAQVYSNILSSNADVVLHLFIRTALLCETNSKSLHSLTEPCLAQISSAAAFWQWSDTGNPPRHRIGVIGAECWGQTLRLIGMAEIVNLRTARKRAARSKAEGHAAEQRLAHGASKTERDRTAADQDKARQTLDQHRIETGDRR